MALFVRDKSFYKTLITLAIPIALQNFLAFAVNFADNLMIGTLGEYVIAGVYMGNQIQTFLQFFVNGVSSALLILAAMYWGKRDIAPIRNMTAFCLRLITAVGILLAVISFLFPEMLLGLFTNDAKVIVEAKKYLQIVCWSYIFFCISQLLMSAMRAVETVRIGLVISISTLFVNVGLNYILIFGKLGLPAMGIHGAAIATLISRIIEAVIMCVYTFVIDQKMQFRMKHIFLRGGDLVKDLVRYGTPVLGGQVVWAINSLAQSAIIGHMNAEAIASVSVAGMLNSLLYMTVLGLSAALGIITGKTVGAGKIDLMKQYAKTAQVLFALIGWLCGAVMFLLRDAFLSLYTLEPETIVVAKQFLTVLAVAMVGRCYQATCLAGLVKAGGDTSFVFKNDSIFVFLVVLPSALIAQNVFHAPAWIVYSCLMSDQILKCFVAVVKINSFNWIRDLTRKNEPAEKKA